MVVRKSDSRERVRRQPARVESREQNTEDVEITHSRLEPGEPLTLDVDEFGGDPYNSTGRFSALIEKKKVSES